MLAYLFVVVAIALRFLHHPLNFTPMAASLLFFGAKMPRKHLWAPLALAAVADVVLTTQYYGYPLTWDHFVTWGWYAGALGIGMLLKRNSNMVRIAGASLAASVSFFLLSNFAVWAVWNMYPKTFNGLMMSYVAGLPFFRNTAIGDLIFTAVLFSVPAIVEVMTGKDARNSEAI